MGHLARGWKPAARLRVSDLIILSFVGVLAGQLARVPVAGVGVKEAPLILTDVLIGMVLAGGAWLLIHERRLHLDRVALVTLSFAIVGGLSTVASVARFGLTAGEALFSLAYLVRWVVAFGLYVIVLNGVRMSEIERIWSWLERAVLLFATFGIIQAAFLPDFAFLVYPEARPYVDWDPQGHRLVSTLLDPNFAGMLLSAGLLVQVARMAFGVRVPRWKVVLLAVALVLTLSRSSVLATLVGGVVILSVRGQSQRLWVTICVLAVGAALAAPWWIPFAVSFNKLSLEDPSGLYRLIQWGWAVTVFMDHPIVGVGFNAYGFVHQRYLFSSSAPATFGLDGGLLFVAVMTGILGLALFLVVLGLLLRNARVAWERPDLSSELRGIALGAGALVPAVTTHSLFANSLLYVPLLHVLWVLWGCAFVIASSTVADAESDPGETEGVASGRTPESVSAAQRGTDLEGDAAYR